MSKAVEYAKAHDLTIIELSDRPLPYGKITDPDVNHIARYDVSAEEWLGYIAHADAVFTNSFHGCCFSTIFERLFFVGKRNGNKVPNFLSEYGLTGQQFSAADSVEEFADTIDFTRAMERLKELRRSSEAFILDALSAAESSIAARTHEDDDKYRRRRREITFSPHFHSGTVVNSDGDTNVTVDAPDSHGKIKVKKLKSRALEYSNPNVKLSNTGEEAMYPSLFRADGHEPIGWTMRFRIDNRWFWYLEDGKVMAVSTGGSELEARKKILADGSRIPQLPVNHCGRMVL